MASADADRNLLFGIFALQNDLITREDLIAAFSAWVLDKSKRLDQILLDQKRLAPDDHALLEPLVRRHLKQHGDDPERSLAALGLSVAVGEALAAVADPDLEATIDFVRSVAAGSEGSQPLSKGTRYRIIRPHARGNLGLVSVALDAELHREVALKEIQSQRADEPSSRARFLLEAEITGRLEHPGVVPVYGLGTNRDGRPYYAMRFVKGNTLKDALEAFHAAAAAPKHDPTERSLSLRKLLNRFTAVCEAMHYAHSRGVIHRDLKPSNILLGPYGETLVVDWGLAKVIGRDDPLAATEATIQPSSGSGSTETQTGAAVGTPAYMSPEQAEGKHDAVGIHSDVYSLGATLYAMVVGKAPLHGGNALDVLRQVQHGSFPPPRRVNPQVPKGLEAIVLKAMSFQPEDRYPTARVLAEDIEHWLADEPVSALLESWPQRAGRWMRRHRSAARAAAVALVAITAVSIASALLIDQARRGERRALGQTKVALAAETQARHETDAQRKRAEEREGLAINAVKKFRDDVANNPDLKDREDLKSLRETLLKEPLEFFKTLRDQLQSSRDTRPESLARLASAVFDLALTTNELGSKKDALRAYGESLAIRERLAREHPTVTEYQHDLARNHNSLGLLRRETGQLAAALESYQQALAIRERLAREHPTVTEYQHDLAGSHNHLGILLRATGQSAAALESYQQALAISERLAREHPTFAAYRIALAGSHHNLGALLSATGQSAAALESVQRALAISERLAREYPTVTAYQSELAKSHNNLGALLRATGQSAAALESYRQALAIRERLAREHPTVTEYRSALAASHYNLGILLRATGQSAAALESYQQALAIRERLAREHPTVTAYQRDLAASHGNLGALRRATGQFAAALESYQQALAISERLAREHLTVTEYQRDLAVSHNSLGILRSETGQSAAALESYQQALAIDERLAREHPTVTVYQSDVGGTLNNLALIEMNRKSWETARERLLQARESQRGALRVEPRNPIYRQFLGNHLGNLAQTCLALRRPEEAAQAARELIELMAGNPGQLYNAACSLAQCVGVAGDELADGRMVDERKKYADEAMTALRAAVTAGWSNASHTASDPDLVALHGRADFRRLLAEMFDRGFPRDPFAK